MMHRRQYWRFYATSRRRLLVVIAVALAEIAALLPVPILVRSLFDHAVTTGRPAQVVRVVLVLALLRVLTSAAALYNRRLALDITKEAIARLRQALYEKLYALSYKNFKSRDVSTLHTTLVEETERVDVMSSALISLFIPSLVAAMALGVVLVAISPSLAMIVAAVAPLIFLIHRIMARSVSRRTDRFRSAFEHFSRGALFVVRGMELTRSAGAARWELERQRHPVSELRRESAGMALSHAAYASAQTVIVSISMLIVLGVGGVAVANGTMTIGTLAGFYVAGALFAGVTNTMWTTLPAIIAGDLSLRAVMELLNAEDQTAYSGHAEIVFNGAIQLHDVSFSYDGEQVLRGINLGIEPGETVALYGPNGAGKTTLVRLILGWERPDSGSVLADDRPYSGLDLPSLVRQLGILPQDPMIFTGTVRENIEYGRADVSEAQLRQAIEDSGAEGTVERLPHGLLTFVGENGRLLSGGQRQRIALARALLGRPRLLILDEPANHLEQHSVERVLRTVRTWPAPPSVLLVSHMKDTMPEADRSYRLENGTLKNVSGAELAAAPS